MSVGHHRIFDASFHRNLFFQIYWIAGGFSTDFSLQIPDVSVIVIFLRFTVTSIDFHFTFFSLFMQGEFLSFTPMG
jgi:hypothetical protein